MITYSGTRRSMLTGELIVLKDNDPLSPAPSQRLINHSPDGFEWGYGGSGPAQLALALLLDATGDKEIALAHYQDFKWDVVAGWGEEWSITSEEILEWVKQRGVALPA